MSLNHHVGLSRSDRADQRAAFELRCDVGAVATLRVARAACVSPDSDLAAFDVAIIAIEAELDVLGACSKTIRPRPPVRAAVSWKKPRFAAGAAAVPAAARAHG